MSDYDFQEAASDVHQQLTGGQTGQQTDQDSEQNSERQYSITSLPSTPVSSEDQQKIHDVIDAAAPSKLPDTIVVLPHKQFRNFASQVVGGSIGGKRVSNAQGSEEHFGISGSSGTTGIGDGFSMVQLGRMYLDSDTLKNPNRLREILTHELGHFQVGRGTEAEADSVKNQSLNPAAKKALKEWAAVNSLPVSSKGVPILNSGLNPDKAGPSVLASALNGQDKE